MKIELDPTTEMLIEEWAKHRAKEPDAPADYEAHVEHLRIRRDRWESQDHGYRLIIGQRLATTAVEELENSLGVNHDDE